MKYKIVFSDVDGTLIPFGKENVSKYTAKTIKALDEMGVELVLATGRGFNIVPEAIKEIISKYIIVANGTGVYDYQNDKTLYQKTMDRDVSIKLIKELRKYDDVIYSAFFDNMVYIETDNLTKMHGSVVCRGQNEIKDLVEEIENNQREIQKVYVGVEPAKQQYYLDLLMRNYPELEFTTFADDNIEIVPIGGNKGEAIKALCKILNIGIDEIIVMGDSDNDLEMLKLGGFNIVPSNANDSAKAVANIISDACENDGPAKELRKIFNIE